MNPGTYRESKNLSWIQEPAVHPGTHRESKNLSQIQKSNLVQDICLRKIMELDLKWVHWFDMGSYYKRTEPWLRIISKLLLTPKRAIEWQKINKNTKYFWKNPGPSCWSPLTQNAFERNISAQKKHYK